MSPEDHSMMFAINLTRFLHNERFADFTVKCKGKTWNVHRIILSANSTFFEKMCRSKFQEATEKLVSLPDDSAFDINLMIEFFYRRQYTFKLSTAAAVDEPSNELELHTRMGTIGDKYGCEDLMVYARGEFEKCFRQRIDKISKAYKKGIESDQDDDDLAEEMFNLVPLIFEPVDYPLREFFLDCFTSLQERGALEECNIDLYGTGDTVMTEYPDFAISLLRRIGLKSAKQGSIRL